MRVGLELKCYFNSSPTLIVPAYGGSGCRDVGRRGALQLSGYFPAAFFFARSMSTKRQGGLRKMSFL